jgi:hypothetical protein
VTPILVKSLYGPAADYLARTGWDPRKSIFISAAMEKRCASLIAVASVRDRALLESAQFKWDEQLAGKGEWKFHLGAVLMLQAWLDASEPATQAATDTLRSTRSS